MGDHRTTHRACRFVGALGVTVAVAVATAVTATPSAGAHPAGARGVVAGARTGGHASGCRRAIRRKPAYLGLAIRAGWSIRCVAPRRIPGGQGYTWADGDGGGHILIDRRLDYPAALYIAAHKSGHAADALRLTAAARSFVVRRIGGAWPGPIDSPGSYDARDDEGWANAIARCDGVALRISRAPPPHRRHRRRPER